MSRALYDILLELNIPQMISERIGRLKEEKRLEEAENEKRVWDVLMEILDTLEGSLKGQNLNFREYKAVSYTHLAGFAARRKTLYLKGTPFQTAFLNTIYNLS